MKILKTRSQLRYTLETGRRVIFEPGINIGAPPTPPSGYQYLTGADGAYLKDENGVYLLVPI